MSVRLQDISIKISGNDAGATGNAYADGGTIGTLTVLSNVCGEATGYCTLQNIVVKDKSQQSSKLEFIFLDADPTNTTITDDVVLVLDDADIDKVIGTVIVAAADYQDYSANSAATTSNIGQILKSAGGADLFLIVLSRGTPTYVADELSYTISFFKDEA